MNIESKELVKIIEACGKNGVSHFKAGEVEIQFNGFVKHTETDYPSKVDQVSHTVKVDPNFNLQQESEIEADDTENLMITDPAAYEESLFKDQLEDSETHTDVE